MLCSPLRAAGETTPECPRLCLGAASLRARLPSLEGLGFVSLGGRVKYIGGLASSSSTSLADTADVQSRRRSLPVVLGLDVRGLADREPRRSSRTVDPSLLLDAEKSRALVLLFRCGAVGRGSRRKFTRASVRIRRVAGNWRSGVSRSLVGDTAKPALRSLERSSGRGDTSGPKRNFLPSRSSRWSVRWEWGEAYISVPSSILKPTTRCFFGETV